MLKSGADEEAAVEQFDKKSINQLLKLGSKFKLIDIDLTEYFRLTCAHLQPMHASEMTTRGGIHHHHHWDARCHNNDDNDEPADEMKKKNSLSYLERRFEEIFLRRFQVLPGFNDLFVFTSLMNAATTRTTSSNRQGLSSIGLGDSGSDAGVGGVSETLAEEADNIDLDDDDDDDDDEKLDEADSDEFEAEKFENYGSDSDDTSSNLDESNGGGVGGGGVGVVDSEGELNSMPTTGYYEDSDSNEPQVSLSLFQMFF